VEPLTSVGIRVHCQPGKFLGVPAGDYTLAAWHEKLGEKTQSLKITAPAKPTSIDFVF
jgi:hypothetical protein